MTERVLASLLLIGFGVRLWQLGNLAGVIVVWMGLAVGYFAWLDREEEAE